MKNMLFALMVMMTMGANKPVKAQGLIESTLLDNVMTVTQFQSGRTKVALMDSVILIGKANGKSIFDLQAGINGDTKPDGQDQNGATFLAGGFFKVSSLMADKVSFPDHWKFLNSIEHGPALMYDFREKLWRGSYQVGLSFGLNPK